MGVLELQFTAITFGNSVIVPFSFKVVGLTIARMFMDMAFRSIYEKKVAKNIITPIINRDGILSVRLMETFFKGRNRLDCIQ